MPDDPNNPASARILICEDEFLVAEDMALTLRDLGYETVGMVATGEEAIRKAEEVRPDLILMDINLAGEIDGIEAVEQIRAQFDIPVVYLTAYGEKDVFERAKKTEPYGYVGKPVRLLELRSTVEMALYKHEADKRVRESEEKYRLISENANIGIFTTALGGAFLQANPAVARMAGYDSVEEFLAIRAEDLYSNESDRRRFVNELLEKGSVKDCEILAQKKDGTPQWVSLNAVLQKDDVGNPVSIVGIVEDITDRKRAEEALGKSESKYRNLFENMSNAVAVYKAEQDGEDFILVHFNAAGERIEKTDKGEVIGQSVLKVFPGVREFGLFDVFRRVWRTSKPEHHPVALYRDEKIEGWRDNFVYKLPTGEIVAVYSDETDRKRAEEELQKQVSLMESLLEAIPAPVFFKDTNHIYLGCNEAFAEFIGLPKENIIGKSVFEVAPIKLADVYKAQDEALFKNPIPQIYESSVKSSDGTTHDVMFHKATFADSSGAVAGLIGVILDITGRKKAEEALRESEEKHRAILANIEEGYYEVDIAGNITFCNEPLSRMLGYTKEELVGMNNREYMDANNAKRVFEAFNRVYATGKPEGMFGWELVRKDGTPRDVEASVSLIKDSEGKPRGFRGVVREVTERKKAEEERRRSQERYRYLIENANDVIFTSDANGYFTLVNSTGLRVSGYSEEEIMGRHYLDLIIPDYREDAARFYGRQLVKRIPDTYYEYPFSTKEGETRWFGQNAHIVIEGDTVTGFQCISRDITDRKKAEQALERSEELLKTILSTSPVGIGLAVDRKMVWVNNAWNEVFGLGLNNAEVLNINAHALYPTQEEFERAGKVLYEGLETGQANETDAIMIRKDGTIFDVHVAMKAVDPSDQSRGTIAAITNITDRKRAEREHERVVSLLRSTLESTADGILVVDMDGRITSFNKRFSELWKIPEDVLASHEDKAALAFALNQLKNPQGFITKVEELYSQPGIESFDVLEFKDGRVFERYSRPQTTGEKIVGRVWSFRDVTEHKRAEEGLTASEERYRLLVENLNDVVYSVDMEGRISYLSPAIERFTGYKTAELIRSVLSKVCSSRRLACVDGAFSGNL